MGQVAIRTDLAKGVGGIPHLLEWFSLLDEVMCWKASNDKLKLFASLAARDFDPDKFDADLLLAVAREIAGLKDYRGFAELVRSELAQRVRIHHERLEDGALAGLTKFDAIVVRAYRREPEGSRSRAVFLDLIRRLHPAAERRLEEMGEIPVVEHPTLADRQAVARTVAAALGRFRTSRREEMRANIARMPSVHLTRDQIVQAGGVRRAHVESDIFAI